MPKHRSTRPRALGREAVRSNYQWALSDDLHLHILSFVTVGDLARCALVCSAWARQTSTNQLWDDLCTNTWSGKHVSEACRSLRGLHAQAALRRSLLEARVGCISRAELCSLTWSFRFKEAAGSAWTATDPWWLGEAARTLQFCADGTICWSDDAWNQPNAMMRWKLQAGCILRVSHAELGAFPGEQLMRHPSNWGFVFHSTWVVYTSFPMARATDDRAVSDRSLDKRILQWQRREALQYNESGLADDSDDDDGPPQLPEL